MSAKTPGQRFRALAGTYAVCRLNDCFLDKSDVFNDAVAVLVAAGHTKIG